MKSKFCFIRNFANLDIGSFIYLVWVGSSLRELTLLSRVEEQCKSKGFYLERWTCLVHSRIEKISARFLKNGYAIACPFRYRYHHDLEFIQSQNRISVLQNAYPRRRKYLSPSF